MNLMHNLLIVDDDEIMRTGIAVNIDWKENGIQVVGTAHNGQECMKMIPTCLPEIILTDIKMPFMDGIQLTEAVYRLYPQIKVVLLTAYDDFKYAQMALNYKVCQYVMKYEDNSTILAAVLRAAKEYDEQMNNKEIVQSSRELLMNRLFCDMVADCQDDAQIAEFTDRLGIQFYSKQFCALCISVNQNGAESSDILFWQKRQLCNKAGILFQQYLDCDSVKVYYFIGDAHLNLLVNFLDGSAQEQKIFFAKVEDTVLTVEKEMNITLCMGIGALYEGYRNISKSYSQAVQALEFRKIVHANSDKVEKVIYFEKIKDNNVSHMTVLKQIISFISAHYHEEDLSMNRIAEEVHLTSSYISTLFKKYQGVNIIDYLTDIRIKKAMELLSGTDLKTYEISEKIGYSNPQYFSVLFKRIVGSSPIEYRKNHLVKHT